VDLQREIDLLCTRRKSLKRKYFSKATSVTYALSDLVDVNPVSYHDLPQEVQGHYHITAPFNNFERNQFDHCDLNEILIKIGKRAQKEELIPYDYFLRLGRYWVENNELIVWASDGHAYTLPLNTTLYLPYRKVYKDLDECIDRLRRFTIE